RAPHVARTGRLDRHARQLDQRRQRIFPATPDVARERAQRVTRERVRRRHDPSRIGGPTISTSRCCSPHATDRDLSRCLLIAYAWRSSALSADAAAQARATTSVGATTSSIMPPASCAPGGEGLPCSSASL